MFAILGKPLSNIKTSQRLKIVQRKLPSLKTPNRTDWSEIFVEEKWSQILWSPLNYRAHESGVATRASKRQFRASQNVSRREVLRRKRK